MAQDRTLNIVLDDLFQRYARRSDVSELKFGLERPGRGWAYRWAAPGSRPQHFIASSTKLYALALVLRLEQRGLVSLGSRAAEYLPQSDLAGLNTHGGVDHWADYTVEQLLSHTSGIPDYFEVAPKGEQSFIQRLLERDFSWTYEDTLAQARKIPAPFSPRPDKAVYSDTNYQLIGRLVETVTGRSFAAALASEVLDPLGLSDTFVFGADTRDRYASLSPMLHGDRRIDTPLAMTSFGVDGDGVHRGRLHDVPESLRVGAVVPQRTARPRHPPLEPGLPAAGVCNGGHAGSGCRRFSPDSAGFPPCWATPVPPDT